MPRKQPNRWDAETLKKMIRKRSERNFGAPPKPSRPKGGSDMIIKPNRGLAEHRFNVPRQGITGTTEVRKVQSHFTGTPEKKGARARGPRPGPKPTPVAGTSSSAKTLPPKNQAGLRDTRSPRPARPSGKLLRSSSRRGFRK